MLHGNQFSIKFWCDTYTLIENNRFGYIILKGNVHNVPDRLKVNKKISIHIIDDISFLIVKVKPKFVKMLNKIPENNPCRLFIVLNQILSVEVIKEYHYDVWLIWNNVRARKNSTYEYQMYRKRIKSGEIKKPDGTIKHLTDGSVGIREAARWSIT